MDTVPQQLAEQVHRALETVKDLSGEVETPRGVELLEDVSDRLMASLELLGRLDFPCP